MARVSANELRLIADEFKTKKLERHQQSKAQVASQRGIWKKILKKAYFGEELEFSNLDNVHLNLLDTLGIGFKKVFERSGISSGTKFSLDALEEHRNKLQNRLDDMIAQRSTLRPAFDRINKCLDDHSTIAIYWTNFDGSSRTKNTINLIQNESQAKKLLDWAGLQSSRTTDLNLQRGLGKLIYEIQCDLKSYSDRYSISLEADRVRYQLKECEKKISSIKRLSEGSYSTRVRNIYRLSLPSRPKKPVFEEFDVQLLKWLDGPVGQKFVTKLEEFFVEFAESGKSEATFEVMENPAPKSAYGRFSNYTYKQSHGNLALAGPSVDIVKLLLSFGKYTTKAQQCSGNLKLIVSW